MYKLILSTTLSLSLSTTMATDALLQSNPSASNILPKFSVIDVKLPQELAVCVTSFEINGSITITLTDEQYQRFKGFINSQKHISVNITASPSQELKKRVIDNFTVPSFESLPGSPFRKDTPRFPSQEPQHVDPTAEVSKAESDQSVRK